MPYDRGPRPTSAAASAPDAPAPDLLLTELNSSAAEGRGRLLRLRRVTVRGPSRRLASEAVSGRQSRSSTTAAGSPSGATSTASNPPPVSVSRPSPPSRIRAGSAVACHAAGSLASEASFTAPAPRSCSPRASLAAPQTTPRSSPAQPCPGPTTSGRTESCPRRSASTARSRRGRPPPPGARPGSSHRAGRPETRSATFFVRFAPGFCAPPGSIPTGTRDASPARLLTKSFAPKSAGSSVAPPPAARARRASRAAPTSHTRDGTAPFPPPPATPAIAPLLATDAMIPSFATPAPPTPP